MYSFDFGSDQCCLFFGFLQEQKQEQRFLQNKISELFKPDRIFLTKLPSEVSARDYMENKTDLVLKPEATDLRLLSLP